MKKHTLQEHITDVSEAYWNTHSGANIEEALRTIWFTAYERWLNDRALMTVEDPSLKEWSK